MNNLDHTQQKTVRTRLFSRVLQVNGPSQLRPLYPHLEVCLQNSLAAELKQSQKFGEWHSVKLAPALRDLSSRLMSLTFFGENLSNDTEFYGALTQYPRDMMASMAAFQIIPGFLSPMVHALITRRGKAMHSLLNTFTSIMDTSESNWVEKEEIKSLTVIRSLTKLSESSSYWTLPLLAQSLLGIWFAASHQPWMNTNFTIIELCARPEYVALLREEIGDLQDLDYEKIEALPILNSFIKETVRLNPLDTMAIRRQALRPFTFSRGTPSLNVGQTAFVSSYNLMHDAGVYPKPNDFNGHRFVGKTYITGDSLKSTSKFTDISMDFPVWGYGSLACPGRFHASLVMKMIIAHLVCRYDFKLQDEGASKSWSWETFKMPFEGTRILIREREC